MASASYLPKSLHPSLFVKVPPSLTNVVLGYKDETTGSTRVRSMCVGEVWSIKGWRHDLLHLPTQSQGARAKALRHLPLKPQLEIMLSKLVDDAV